MNEASSCMANVSVARREIGSPQRVLIALSGGADSVALFCVLKELAHLEKFEIAAVHVNHGLRDTASRDEMFCEQLCAKNSVPFFKHHLLLKGASEQEARLARYEAFADAYKTWHAEVIALAHHRGDQAETLLMHLFRGSGSKGAAGMKLLSKYEANGMEMHIFRPLLSWPKESLKAIALEQFGSFCCDETNDNDMYTRNYLRTHVMPVIMKRMPKAEEALCRAADIFQAENDLLDTMAKQFLAKHASMSAPVPFIEYPPFSALHLAMRRRVMQLFLPFEEGFERIDSAANILPGKCVNLRKRSHLYADEKLICIVHSHSVQQTIAPFRVEPSQKRTGNGIRTQSMPTALYSECSLRYRQSGDFIQPFGMQGTKSLQDYLVDRKVSEPMRDHLPLFCKDSEVIWVIGIGASEKVRNIDSKESIFLTYTGRLPYEKDERGNTHE